MLVIEDQIARQRGLQVLPRTETGGCQNVADTPVEALDPAVGLRMARRDQAVRNGPSHAPAIKGGDSGS